MFLTPGSFEGPVKQKSSMRRGRAPLPRLLLAAALPLGIDASSAAAAPPVHVTFPMSDPFIGDGASAACGFQASATDSGHGPLRGPLPEPFGNAWTAKVRCRHGISATEGTDRG